MISNIYKDKYKEKIEYSLNQMKKKKYAYAFTAPFLLIFIVFTLIPVVVAISYSFTYFDVLQPAKWIGLENYIRMLVYDKIFLLSVKNTVLLAVITGPISYLLCFFIAWIINELSPKLRAFMTLLFYAPTLANIFVVWKIIFSADAYGLINSYLIKLGFIYKPIQWLADVQFIPYVAVIVILWSSLGTSFLAFIAGLQNVDRSLFEAGAVDGIKNRFQELWFITLPSMRSQLLFSAVMSITASFGIGAVITGLFGFPSTEYVVHTMMNHMEDYGGMRFEMGYACGIATILFIMMISINQIIQRLISKIGK